MPDLLAEVAGDTGLPVRVLIPSRAELRISTLNPSKVTSFASMVTRNVELAPVPLISVSPAPREVPVAFTPTFAPRRLRDLLTMMFSENVPAST